MVIEPVFEADMLDLVRISAQALGRTLRLC